MAGDYLNEFGFDLTPEIDSLDEVYGEFLTESIKVKGKVNSPQGKFYRDGVKLFAISSKIKEKAAIGLEILEKKFGREFVADFLTTVSDEYGFRKALESATAKPSKKGLEKLISELATFDHTPPGGYVE